MKKNYERPVWEVWKIETDSLEALTCSGDPVTGDNFGNLGSWTEE